MNENESLAVLEGIESLRKPISACVDKTLRDVRSPQEKRLRDAVSVIIHHNRRIREQMAAPADPGIHREDILNPECNGARAYLNELGEAVKAYRPGEIPQAPLSSLKKSTVNLIRYSLEPLVRNKTWNISMTVVSGFVNYLSTRNESLTDARHREEVDEHIARLIRRFCQNSDACYEAEESRRSGRNPRKRTRKGTKGTQTKRMKKQLRDFVAFIDVHPVNEHRQCETISARARQFWGFNNKTFGKAAAASGEKRGYKSPQALASAYRARTI